MRTKLESIADGGDQGIKSRGNTEGPREREKREAKVSGGPSMGFPRPRNLRPDYLFVGAINAVPAAKNLSIHVSIVLCLLTKHSFVRMFTDGFIASFIILVIHLFIYGFIYLFNCMYASVVTNQLANLFSFMFIPSFSFSC